MQHEGLLTEAELRDAAHEWVRERSFGGIPCCCCLAQTEVNALVTEFPQTHSRQKLAQMVEYQIHQLCGLTEEHFLSDYHALDGADGDNIPIVLAVSRASQVEERLEYMQGCGLAIEQATSEGMALYNAFKALEGDAALRAGVQLLLDVSSRSVVLVQLKDGRLQRLSTFSLEEGALSRDLAERLADEIHGIEGRILQEGGAVSVGETRARLAGVWLSGGHGDLSLLAEMLKRQMAAEVRVLGVPASSCPRECYCGAEADGVLPALTIAYGLALQSIGDSTLHVSILPELLVWQQSKMSIFPYMVALYVLLLLALVFQAVTYSYNIYHQRERLRQREGELDAIASLVPQIEAAYRDLEHQQLRLMPLVELGSRADQYLKAIDAWQQLRNAEDGGADAAGNERWCVYLADNFAFKASSDAAAASVAAARGKGTKGGDGASGERRRGGGASATPPAASEEPSGVEAALQEAVSLFGTLAETRGTGASAKKAAAEDVEASGGGEVAVAPPLPARFPVRGMQRLSTMYAAGFVVQDEASYLTLKRMQERLNQGSLFVNVDDYVDFVAPALLNSFISPWEHFLVMNREALGRNYTTFFLKMPLMESSVDYAPEEGE